MATLLARLRTIRRARGLNQAQAGAEIGVARYTLSRWETGAMVPSRKHKAAIRSWLKGRK